jgi:dimethylglycine catabolism B
MENKALIPPGLTYLADNIKLKDNILGASKEEGAKWAKNLNLPKASDTIFFAGCGYQFEDKLESLMGLIRKMDKSLVGSDMAMGLAGFQRKLGFDAAGTFLKVMGRGKDTEAAPLVDAIKVLRKIGENPAYLAENEPCCGAILHFMGLQEDFAAHSRQVYEKLQSLGVKTVIGIVPSCTYALRKLMADLYPGNGFTVKHFCEVVAGKVDSLDLRFPHQVKVTYHDPCQLVRYMGLIEEPRKILRAINGLELVEPKWTKGEWSTCCGGGGGFEAVFPEMSEMLAVNRAKELMETGAQIIVTHCPGCIMQLQTGLKALKVDNVEVLDLSQVVAMSLEEK